MKLTMAKNRIKAKLRVYGALSLQYHAVRRVRSTNHWEYIIDLQQHYTEIVEEYSGCSYVLLIYVIFLHIYKSMNF